MKSIYGIMITRWQSIQMYVDSLSIRAYQGNRKTFNNLYMCCSFFLNRRTHNFPLSLSVIWNAESDRHTLSPFRCVETKKGPSRATWNFETNKSAGFIRLISLLGASECISMTSVRARRCHLQELPV